MLKPGKTVPALELPLTIGAQYDLAKQRPDNFTLVMFYRGSHCPVCRSYLEQVGSKVETLSEHGINPVAVSMDAQERAMKVDSDWETGDLPLAYAMTEETAREWGSTSRRRAKDRTSRRCFQNPACSSSGPTARFTWRRSRARPSPGPTSTT
ncbi:MAG: AhpC/TSA family [Erythrobacteraceae bacterium HL-111]|nr:MAG: AhpC/TSA family [Erythrobacteraceae bacterium HL-111]